MTDSERGNLLIVIAYAVCMVIIYFLALYIKGV